MQDYVDFLIKHMGENKCPKQLLIESLEFGIAKVKLAETRSQSRSTHALFSPDQDWVIIANEMLVHLKKLDVNEEDGFILALNIFAPRIAYLKSGNELFILLKAFLSVFKQYAILLDTKIETALTKLVDSALNVDVWQVKRQDFCMTCICPYGQFKFSKTFESLRHILPKNKFERIVQDHFNLAINAPESNNDIINYFINLAVKKTAVILPDQYQRLIKKLLTSLSERSISILIRLRRIMKKEDVEKFFNQLCVLLRDGESIIIQQAALVGIGSCAKLVSLDALVLAEPLVFQFYTKYRCVDNPANQAEQALIDLGEVLISEGKFQETLENLFTQSANIQETHCSSACYLLLRLLSSLNVNQRTVVIQNTLDWFQSTKLSNQFYRLNDVLTVIFDKKEHISDKLRDMIMLTLVRLIDNDKLSMNHKCSIMLVISKLGCKLDERTMDSLLSLLIDYLNDFIQDHDYYSRCDEARLAKTTLLSLLHWMTGENKIEFARFLFLLRETLSTLMDIYSIMKNLVKLADSITGDINLTEFYQLILGELNNPDFATDGNLKRDFALEILQKINPGVIPSTILANILDSLMTLITSQCDYVREDAFYACSHFAAFLTDIQRENIEDLLPIHAAHNQYYFVAALKECVHPAAWPKIVKFLLDNLDDKRDTRRGDGLLDALQCYFSDCSDDLKNEVIRKIFTWMINCTKETPCFWPALHILQACCCLATLNNYLSYQQRLTVITKLLQYIDCDHPFPYGQHPSDPMHSTFILPAIISLIPTLTYNDRLILLAQLAERKNPSWEEKQLFICLHALNENEILLRYSEKRLSYVCEVRDITRLVIRFC